MGVRMDRQRARFIKIGLYPGQYDKSRVACVLNSVCVKVCDCNGSETLRWTRREVKT